MEAPAKRLRILRSVEVDETNPDYIAAKHKQQEKFKGRLEKLFAKYGDMHESMSDEIDFNTGKVVVDRGHLRRVQRHMKRKGPGLLDSLLAPELQREDSPEEGEGHIESEDELAPTQTRKRKRDSVEDGKEVVQGLERQNAASVTSPLQAMSTVTAHANALQVPSTPNPGANLFQQIQQTPLDQQAQAALLANLNQTIAQAVSQAVAPFLRILQNTPKGQAAAPLFPAPSPHLPAIDSVRPAADPKWYFPPISAASDIRPSDAHGSSPPITKEAQPQTTRCNDISSPIVARRSSPKVRVPRRQGTAKTKQSSRLPEPSVERCQSSHSLPASCLNNDTKEASLPNNDTPSNKVRRVRSLRKYCFTDEDDVYISKRRELHNMSFKAIKDSKAKWSQWPPSAIYNHWNNRLKDKNLHLRDGPGTASIAQHPSETPVEHEEHYFSSIEIPETSSAEHRLPTPSSLEQEDSHVERAMVPSSSHFNDDELELLSLAGADVSDDVLRHSSQCVDDMYPTPDEPLPSIEDEEFENLRDEDELQKMLQDELRHEMKVEDSPMPAAIQSKNLPSTIPETQESIRVASTPNQKQAPNAQPKSKSKPRPIPTNRAATDATDDLDLIGSNDGPKTKHVYIKQEPLSPQATRILCSSPAPKTPRNPPQSSGSIANSTGKLDRRAFLKEVKQGWAKAKGKTHSSQKRRSLNALSVVKNRPWAEGDLGDSEDELAV
ncbi:hypothetical protein E8E12_010222 [Didymella heteroderae]|uniref:Uncharacterized protein n=1 Tax=Didymella heteroderae TaxID=1769908 RepID=A0A9P5C5W9_9PLEO|nr:hypothetical protein E8E12_010222 [Didymella heteroderae]